MGLFTALAGALALATALILVRPLIAGRRGADSGHARDVVLYRDQLDEIGRDLARGTIGTAEAEGARAEVSRRLIAAAERAEKTGSLSPAPAGRSRLMAALALLGAPALAVAIYLANGWPGMPDLPFASRTDPHAMAARPSQVQAEKAAAIPARVPTTKGEKEYADLIAQLETVIAQRPDDIEGRRLLASGYLRLGRPGDAWHVYETLIVLLGKAAEPELYAAQLDAMVQAAGGYVSPEAEAVLKEAEARDPKNPVVRYYSGLVLAQDGKVAEAVQIWEKLKADAPADAPWRDFLDSMLAEAKAVQSGTPAPGPNASQVEAAQGMSPEERQTMIAGMVARLETRLTTEGGTLEEWVRLINAYVKLGRTDDAKRIYQLALAKVGAEERGALHEQALLLGVASE